MFNYYLQLIVDESPCAAVITLTLIVAKYVSGKIGILGRLAYLKVIYE